MPGLAELILGAENPVAQFANSNRYALGGLGAGLASGRTFGGALANAAQGVAAARPYDDERALRTAEEAKQREYVNQTQQFLQNKYPDLAQAIGNGASLDAVYSELFARERGGESKPNILNAGGGNLYNADTEEWLSAPQPEAAPGGALSGLSPEDLFKLEDTATKTYRGEADVKSYQDVRNAYERVRESALTDSGPGDLGLIFGYMKMLDPGSVVREGEFATAENAGGVAPQILNLYNKALTGERLTPEMRQQFVSAAERLYAQTADNLTTTNDRYSGMFTRYGLDPANYLVTPEQYSKIDAGTWTDVGNGVKIRRKN